VYKAVGTVAAGWSLKYCKASDVPRPAFCMPTSIVNARRIDLRALADRGGRDVASDVSQGRFTASRGEVRPR
jgi:hypothetical protein